MGGDWVGKNKVTVRRRMNNMDEQNRDNWLSDFVSSVSLLIWRITDALTRDLRNDLNMAVEYEVASTCIWMPSFAVQCQGDRRNPRLN